MKSLVADYKLIELIDMEEMRESLLADLKKLLNLTHTGSDEYYQMYKDIIAVATNKGKLWENLSDKDGAEK